MRQIMATFAVIICTALLVTAVGGCTLIARSKPVDEQVHALPYVSPNPEPATVETPDEPAVATVALTLYFADFQAQHVVPEQREVADGTLEQLATLAVEGLIDGPRDRFLRPTIPNDSRLLGLTVADGKVVLDFSTEFRTNHPGGSAGETMTLDSIVLTLTDLPGIELVRILVEGQELDSLSGHIYLGEPLSRGPIREYPVFVDLDRMTWLQRLADEGKDNWRLDPVKVASSDGRMLGFTASDTFEPVSAADGQASVRAVQAGREYIIRLTQPVKTGSSGVWAVTGVEVDR